MSEAVADVSDGVEVRRSRRRRSTVTAYREDGRTIVLIPDRFSRRQEAEWVERMVARLAAQETRRRPAANELAERAGQLSRRYLNGEATPLSVTWATNQNTRWGSCTPADGTIRLSTRLRGMPAWVIDYVLVHELAHLLEPSHSARFWALVAAYPRAERARGFLEGFSAARDPRTGQDDDQEGDALDQDGGMVGQDGGGVDQEGEGGVSPSSRCVPPSAPSS